MRTEAFVSDVRTPLCYLGILRGSVPIDMFFNTMFEAETYAHERTHYDPDVGILESIVAENGVLHEVHVDLAKPILVAELGVCFLPSDVHCLACPPA